jgi:hypothetical protein
LHGVLPPADTSRMRARIDKSYLRIRYRQRSSGESKRSAPVQASGKVGRWRRMGLAEFKSRNLGSDRGYRVALGWIFAWLSLFGGVPPVFSKSAQLQETKGVADIPILGVCNVLYWLGLRRCVSDLKEKSADFGRRFREILNSPIVA